MSSDKYNRTFHMPWSLGCTNDDKIAKSVNNLINTNIIITEKIDGSNTSLENKGCFARTHSGPPTHASFDGLKALHASIKWKIPNNLQLFGEWCFALHSIVYQELPDYFLLFNIRNISTNSWLSWEEVELWAMELELHTVPVLFKGTINSEKEFKKIVENLMVEPSVCGGIREGVVARVEREFLDEDFPFNVMKCVRKNHVQTSEHWKNQEIIKNKLKTDI